MPPADAQGGKALLGVALLHFEQQRVQHAAPDAPIGWPMAMAPPLTLTLSGSQPKSLLTAQAWAAKASLASTRSRSSTDQPAFLQRLARWPDRAGAHDGRIDAGMGPDAMRASGVMPRFVASSADISTRAAAPSLMPDALPAVTVPSLSKAGRSLADASFHAVADDIRPPHHGARPCVS